GEDSQLRSFAPPDSRGRLSPHGQGRRGTMKPGATQAVVRRIAAMVCGWLAAASLAAVLISNSAAQNEPPKVSGGPLNPLPGLGEPLARDPIFVYNNWSAYDELSDNVLLTEQLAMKELDEILRLRRLGVRIDYYTIDAFWF